MKFTEQHIIDLGNKTLASIHNDLLIYCPEALAPVKRFSDKESAIRRTLAVLNNPDTDLSRFAKDHTEWAEMLGLKKEKAAPKKAKAKKTTEVNPTSSRRAAPQGDDAKHFNLRCPNDGYVIKTAKLYLDWARPLCPVCNAMVLTVEERKALKEKEG